MELLNQLGKYFTFEGRINRAKYFLIPLGFGIINFFVSIILDYTQSVLLATLYLGVLLAFVVASICITVQRLHDLERPGCHYFLLLVPLYNIYLSLVLLFKKGTDGPNMYGDDPLEL